MGSRPGITLSESSLVKLAKRQQSLGLTDGQVAEKIGTKRIMYLYLRTGERKANPETVERLCSLMGFRLQPARLVEK